MVPLLRRFGLDRRLRVWKPTVFISGFLNVQDVVGYFLAGGGGGDISLSFLAGDTLKSEDTK